MTNEAGQQWQNLKNTVSAAAVKYPNDKQAQENLEALRAVMFHQNKDLFRMGPLCKQCQDRTTPGISKVARNAETLEAMLHHMNAALQAFCHPR